LSFTLGSYQAVHFWLPISAQTTVFDSIPAVPYGNCQDPDMPPLDHCLTGRSQLNGKVAEITDRAIFPGQKIHI
jgi:hypothetical protein